MTFELAEGARTVFLPGRRFRLIAALLVPPLPYVVGDFVPDAVLVPLVWNDTDEAGSRTDINVLMTRVRHDLTAANLAATSIIERAPGGRATRVIVLPGAKVRTAS